MHINTSYNRTYNVKGVSGVLVLDRRSHYADPSVIGASPATERRKKIRCIHEYPRQTNRVALSDSVASELNLHAGHCSILARGGAATSSLRHALDVTVCSPCNHTLHTRLFPPRASPRALLRRSRSPSTLRHRAPIRPPSLHMPCHGSSSARGAERPPQPLPTKADAPPRRHRAGLGAAPRSGRSCASDPRCCASDPRLRFMTQIHDG